MESYTTRRKFTYQEQSSTASRASITQNRSSSFSQKYPMSAKENESRQKAPRLPQRRVAAAPLEEIKGRFSLSKVGSDFEEPRQFRSKFDQLDLGFQPHGRERARSNSKERVKTAARSSRQFEINYQKPLKLIQNAEHVQVGTIMYSQSGATQKVTKQFIPIFPFLYDQVQNGKCIQQGEFCMPGPSRIPIPIQQRKKDILKDTEEVDEGLLAQNLPTKANLRFTMENDPLFGLEETRANSQASLCNSQGLKAKYICDLEIINFKNVIIFTQSQNSSSQSGQVKKSRAIVARIYITLQKPCTVSKIYPENEQKPQEVRSPFRHPTELFMNYWNLHQVFYIGGTSFQDSIDRFVDIIRARNPLCKVKLNSNLQDSEVMPIIPHMTQPSVANGKSQLIPSIVGPIKDLLHRSHNFKNMMPQLRLQTLFSLLAVLSQDKVNLFNDSFIELTRYIIQQSDCNESDEMARITSGAIDQMVISETLDYKKTPNLNLTAIFQKYMLEKAKMASNSDRSKLDSVNYMKQRRLIITPTVDLFQIEVEDETCLALRKYKQHISRFVRVTFANERLSPGFYQMHTDGGKSLLLGYIHSILKQGHVIHPRCVLKFLSYSNSQIKRHSAWFLVNTGTDSDALDEDYIMRSMGDFAFEKNVLKQYARRGQCFSTAKFITELSQSDIQLGLPDIKRNGFTFTDGCGYISQALAQQISEQFQLPFPATAFQIRIGGAKGVLMVMPDDKLSVDQHQYHVRLRDSQVKFSSPDLSLNVVRCATYSQGFLNRQLIILLSCLGVPDHVFLDLQKESKEMASVSEIYKKLLAKSNKVVRAFKKKVSKNRDLCQQELGQLMKFNIGPSKWFQDTMKESLLAGFEIQKDPIMSSILYTMQLSQMICLKKKARVLVKDSTVLIGVVDDMGILGPNQIFCQLKQKTPFNSGAASKKKARSRSSPQKIDNQSNNSDESFDLNDDGSKILEGKVLVSRNPCTHPGDVRLLEAVDIPELRHLTNVVVFPSTGLRPLCNMMAGGDLDGDVYFVCWDERILNHVTERSLYAPATYTKPDLIKEKPAEESIADYYTFFLERDVLGQLANLHLNLCDYLGKSGPCDPRCIELSGLQSIAVDFAKHGECVPRDQFSEFLKMTQDWPDFFEKSSKKVRASQGILGQLYRDLTNEQGYKDYMQNQYTFQVLMKWELDQKILSKASSKEILLQYLEPVYTRIVAPMERQIRSLMYLFRQNTESALFASDLKFHISQATTEDIQTTFKFMRPDPITGAKPEEALSILNMKLTMLTKSFKQKLRQLIEEQQADFNAETNICAALYFVSYFHIKNISCRNYLKQLTPRENEIIFVFIKAWETDYNRRSQKVKPQTMAKLTKSSFPDYFEETKKIEECLMTNPKRLQEAIELKKLFSIPWLLASELLFTKQDFLKRIFSMQLPAAAPLNQSRGRPSSSQSSAPQVIQVCAVDILQQSQRINTEERKVDEYMQETVDLIEINTPPLPLIIEAHLIPMAPVLAFDFEDMEDVEMLDVTVTD